MTTGLADRPDNNQRVASPSRRQHLIQATGDTGISMVRKPASLLHARQYVRS
jgi:hypothetical protein